ncbi:TAF5-like RNA polymerase II p300/CBP-associated factor-associated factor 65 kDa subunit 5L [Pomacea canaliculata]|uniref:TAF5-like RNA polymerase II p300/CBP-associated factor-associated factor 65 kDa subunit 5L n=1 Tax=Pomacea canaliculata TaxID=400727 RepID=UPI000D72B8DA|nr:TAF5-like RNA polymerase II p300/CBP-associated factor-associated factor 65 kDa subunit 5L [Pomacea canaliculata]
MKRAKSEQIRSAVITYLKRRQYQESEIHVLTRKEGKKDLTTELEDMSVKKQIRLNAGTENSVACSSISGDFVSCDQQFARLRKHILESADNESKELSSLLYPLFVHIYVDLLSSGYKPSAHKFHERHNEIFHSEEQKDFIRCLRKLESRAELLVAKDVMDFREHRFCVSLSQESVKCLLNYLKAGDNMIILQIINQNIKIQVIKDGTQSLELQRSNSPASSAYECPDGRDKEKEDEADPSAMSVEDAELLKSLRETICRVRALPPNLPSVCFYTFINAYQGLCTSNVSPDARLICGGFEDSSIQLWRLQPEPLASQSTESCNSNITLAADFIYKDEDERKVKIDLESQEAVTLRAHSGPVYKTAFSPDSRYILSCSRDATVRLWDLTTRSNVAIYQGHSGCVWDVDFCEVTGHFATSSHDQTVKLWSMDRIYPLRSFVGHTYDVDCVAVHPNGNYVASGSGDRSVRLWSIQDGKCVRLFSGHRGSILGLAFSPNGQLLASAGEDRRVHIWDLGSGALLKDLRGHSDTVHSLAFSRCNAMVASGGMDCYIRIWDVRRGNEPTSPQLVEGHTSAELLGAFPTKSATVSFLRFARHNLLLAAGAIQ